jgi:uncharacterized protein (TIGR02145 family)
MIKPLLIILVLFFGFGNSYTQETIEELQLKSEGLKKDINQLKIEKEQKLSELEKELEPINKKLIEKDNELLVLEVSFRLISEKIGSYNITPSQSEAYNILKDQTLFVPTESGKKKLESFKSKLIKSDVIASSVLLVITNDNTYFFNEENGRILELHKLTVSQYDEATQAYVEVNDEKQTKALKKLKNKGLLIPVSDLKKELKQLTGIDDEYFNLKENKQQLNTKIAICKTSQGEIQDEVDSKNNEISETIEKFENQLSELLSETSTIELEIESIELEIESIIAEQKRQERIQKYNRTVKKKKIGTQVWMTKNLDVEYFRNGDPIPHCKTEEERKEATEKGQPAWCYYENDPNNGKKYGKLYNWHALNDTRGLAPEGWHIPSVDEWEVLFDDAGWGKVNKWKSTYGWDSYKDNIYCTKCENWPSEYRSRNSCHTCFDTRIVGERTVSGNGNNSSGFNGLPPPGSEGSLGQMAMWWSSTEGGTGTVKLDRFNVYIFGHISSTPTGVFSVRLIQSNKEWTLRNEEKILEEEKLKEEKILNEEQRIIRLKSSTIKIGNLEVMTKDLGRMEWEDAKKACADLGDGWRLPTKDELNILYQNKDVVGGFYSSTYWSSTETDDFNAWGQAFNFGEHASLSKDYTNFVRAIRAF